MKCRMLGSTYTVVGAGANADPDGASDTRDREWLGPATGGAVEDAGARVWFEEAAEVVFVGAGRLRWLGPATEVEADAA